MTERTALITGCSSGFGRLAAATFSAKGWNVVATMRRPETESELTTGDRMLVTALDVTEPASIASAVAETIERFGAIDVLVNNAGYGGYGLVEQGTDEHARAMFDTNVFGLMGVCRAVLPHMREAGGGTIVNVTSMTAMIPIPNGSVYTASKFAAQGFTEALNLECRPMGITVRAVLPGAYPTSFGANSEIVMGAGDDELRDLAGRFGAAMAAIDREPQDPQDVADMIYACATTDMPIVNPCGADANRFVEVLESGTRDDFLEHLATLFTPPA